jgi:arylsulfatase A-like enzyme
MRITSVGRRGASALLAGLAIPALLAACVGKAPAPVPAPVPTDGRPNIVFVLTDDLSMNLLPYMPHVQALAERGTSFSNYYVVDSLCCPSRAAILTGTYPHNNGVLSNKGDHDGGFPAWVAHRDQGKSFGVALQNAGYYTGFLGKYLNEYQPDISSQPGWDEWDVAGNAYSEYNYQLNENNEVHAYGHAPDDYFTHVIAGKAREFLGRSRYTGKPFALEVATFAPHRPYTPAPIDRGTFPALLAPQSPSFGVTPLDAPHWLADLPSLATADIDTIDQQFRLRVEAVQAVDRMIGQLEQALAASGRLDDTYFVFSSDNGYHMGEHNLMPGKQTAFDTDIRVPLIVAGPDVPAGRTVDAMMSSIDLAPTFLDLAQAEPTGLQDGVSMADVWRGEPVPTDWQQGVLIEHRGPVRAATDPDVQSPRSGNPPSYEAIRTASYLYVEYVTGEREFYDTRTDPDELVNRYGSLDQERRDQLHEQVTMLEACSGAEECQRATAPANV